MTVRTIIGAGFALALLAGCAEEEIILPGERLDIRDAPVFVNQVADVSLPAARANADWTHRNGGADHLISHPALGASLTAAFVAPIGEGDSLRARITADPVVADGIVYTLDARTTVTATSVTGQTVWTRTLPTGLDNRADASGGGVSVAGGQVFVTTGFGDISALDSMTGTINWTQDLDAPALSPPTINGDLVYVVARDSSGWALDVTNGRIRWQISNNPSTANFSGSASPATNGNIVVFPFPSGEVVATFPQGGQRRWASAVTGDRLGRAAALVTDITSDPVIDGQRVYVGNFGGRTAALNLLDGERIWTASEGAISPVWPVGNAVFLINDISQLVRLDAQSGEPVWRVALPDIVGERKARQREFVGHYGPILAGGRLIVASTDGLIRQFDPASGALVRTLALPGGAASHPVVAGQTLYVVSKSGQLHAFR
ncbi:PQQ-like beta-propeller repeat protein [Yoonia sediminilitoris]|uniref:Outer membrane protein assembly factor BamB n=1 Tax=Yoonia sediminilitoris TaxID=1286148 RepID=A0A2T6KDS7_9RHOB|nr:PQQ-like beta-propeller repeat protein [Yoonia sediminilitoris]PUB13196.1 outer membrane protein assembly factor BamB [Yoonia sediminilitoris]RCW94531.1 outer membrane protein assembly factor BamB [Yoonia sediminilitoris]